MSLIVNADFLVGDPVVTTDLNKKFTDVQTATTNNLDNANFREESQDCLQFPTRTSDGENGIILRDWLMVDNGITQTGGTYYVSTINATPPVAVAHGSTNPRLIWPITGTELSVGDLLRVRYSVFLQDLEVSFTFSTDGGALTDYPVWLIWLQWDITSAALVNWTAVPNQGDLMSSYVTAEGSVCSNCQSTMVLPHAYMVMQGGVDSQLEDLKNLSLQRGYSYINETASKIDIYGIRMVINGLYHPYNTSNTGNINAFAKDNVNPGWSGERIRIANARMLAVIQRGD